jgi:hypothetical protein
MHRLYPANPNPRDSSDVLPMIARTFTNPASQREGGLVPCPGRRCRMGP